MANDDLLKVCDRLNQFSSGLGGSSDLFGLDYYDIYSCYACKENDCNEGMPNFIYQKMVTAMEQKSIHPRWEISYEPTARMTKHLNAVSRKDAIIGNSDTSVSVIFLYSTVYTKLDLYKKKTKIKQ